LKPQDQFTGNSIPADAVPWEHWSRRFRDDSGSFVVELQAYETPTARLYSLYRIEGCSRNILGVMERGLLAYSSTKDERKRLDFAAKRRATMLLREKGWTDEGLREWTMSSDGRKLDEPRKPPVPPAPSAGNHDPDVEADLFRFLEFYQAGKVERFSLTYVIGKTKHTLDV
jgi:hypothetical protein